jgi:hypothetical protein
LPELQSQAEIFEESDRWSQFFSVTNSRAAMAKMAPAMTNAMGCACLQASWKQSGTFKPEANSPSGSAYW